MRIAFLRPLVLALVLTGAAAFLAASDGTVERTPLQLVERACEQHVLPVLRTYCMDCHDRDQAKGDIDFSNLRSGVDALIDRDLVLHGIDKLLAHEMPPSTKPQPSEDQRRAIAEWLTSLRRLSPPDPGPNAIRRMSRAEYANTLHDLLGADPAVAAELPADTVGAGFDSSISPLLMEKYLLVVDEVLDRAIRPGQMIVRWNGAQLDAIVASAVDPGKDDGLERTLTGAAQVVASIPAPIDGTYTVRVRAASDRIGREPVRLAVRVGNQIVGELKITAPSKAPGTYSLSCKLPAGKAALALIIVNPAVEAEPAPAVKAKPAKTKPAAKRKPASADQPAAEPAKDAVPAAPVAPPIPMERSAIIHSVEVAGPPAALASDVQRRLFVAMPSAELAKRDAARAIATAFARRAWRRPASADEIDVLMRVFDLADGQDEIFSESIKLMLKAVLVSPQFLFIAADDTPGPDVSGIVAVGDHQLAAKLSYLFWATTPDDELAALADAGTLDQPEVLVAQVRRLIADRRARAFFDGFGAAWLGLDKLEHLLVDEKKHPAMKTGLRRAMYEEGALLFMAVLHEKRSLIDLFTADFTFVDQGLAAIYGLDGAAKGGELRRVTLTDANRGGVLGLPGVLAVTSLPTRTSPVKRGKWFLEQVLGRRTPTPPMNVAALEQQDTAENAALNLRERTERHRSDPACAGCHQMFDPLGFALENFDAIGRWRDQDDTGHAVDAVGELPGGVVVRGPADLKRLIVTRRDEVSRALVARVLAYALCRDLTGYDLVVADEIAARVAANGYRLDTLLECVATSYPFLNRRLNR